MSLLELENVVTAYGKVEALKGLTLRVEQGEIVALIGSNGAGKSTTLRTISGLVRPLSGTMRFLGQPIDRLSPEAIVKLGVAHVPEHRRVFPGLTVRENILLGGSNGLGIVDDDLTGIWHQLVILIATSIRCSRLNGAGRHTPWISIRRDA